MIKWRKEEAGSYISEDGRFRIIKTWNRVYGNHWQMRDTKEPDYYKGLYYERSFLDCKLRAEALLDAGMKPGFAGSAKGKTEL